jgi:hypothetical protein
MRLAERCRGRRAAEELMANMTLLLAHVMTYGQLDDVALAKQFFTASDFLCVLDEAPAKVFDPWSWNYWNAIFHRTAPAQPVEWFAFKYVRRTGKEFVSASDINACRGPKIHWI